MPIDSRMVKWDDAPDAGAIDPKMVKWDDAPKAEKPSANIRGEGFNKAMNYSGADAVGGLVRGAGSIGATVMRALPNALGGDTAQENEQRRTAMDEGLTSLIGSNPDSMGYKTTKLVSEVGGTLGVGGALGKGVSLIAPRLGSAIQSAGMTTGSQYTPGLMNAIKDLAIRATGGAVTGGAAAGLVNPKDAGVGAAIGGAFPVGIKVFGEGGKWLGNKIKGGQTASGKQLAEAIDLSPSDLAGVIKSLNAAPDGLVDGSKFTMSQALQNQGNKQPGVQMMERTVAGGKGGNALLKRYSDQGDARLISLTNHGALMDESARDVATRGGDKLGAMLRTQASDERATTSAAWKALEGRAVNDGVALQIPLDELQAAMKPLGRGTVGAGADARSFLSEAKNIGTMELPSIAALKAGPASKSQNLEQAVRSAGGLLGKQRVDGRLTELGDLGIRESGTTGLINNKSGKSADILAEEMYRRGFISEPNPDLLVETLRNGGGRKIFANDQVENNAYQRMAESAMGDAPAAGRVAIPVPFDEFQRLRSSAGELAAKAGNAGNKTEAGVLNQFKSLLEGRVNDASAGNMLAGEVMPLGFKGQYNAARDGTRQWYERYGGGNNIESILRKPVGQDYTLTGDEIMNKLWHGGSGLGGDVSNLKRILSGNNQDPAMKTLREYIMTDAATKTTASGNLGAALPKYVANRMPGLAEALTPEQFKAITNVASDIRNADAAMAVKGLAGSDTQGKIDRAMGAGLLGSKGAEGFAKMLTFKGIGLDNLRSKAAATMIEHKGKAFAELLANPKLAAKAMADSTFTRSLDPVMLSRLQAAARFTPVLAAD